MLLELLPFVIRNGFCIDSLINILKESVMEFHQTLQTHSYLQDKNL